MLPNVPEGSIRSSVRGNDIRALYGQAELGSSIYDVPSNALRPTRRRFATGDWLGLERRFVENFNPMPRFRQAKAPTSDEWKRLGTYAGVGAIAGTAGLGAGLGFGIPIGADISRRQAEGHGKLPVPPVDAVIAQQAYKKARYEPLPPEPAPKRRKEQEIDYGQWLPYYTSHSRYSAPEYFPRY